MTLRPLLLAPFLALAVGSPALASEGAVLHGPTLAGVRVEFLLFALTLLGVALFHKHTLYVALGGLVAISGWSFGVVGVDPVEHLLHEGVGLLNLLGLLLGFTLLAKHFEESKIPDKLPAWLPDDWKGGYVLLILVAVLSSFLDNIAAAMIGGTMARVLYKGKVHIGFLAAIVAASNAGGAGSVVGDTTTTMMWIDPVRKVAPLEVSEALVGSCIAVLFSGFFAARQQHAHQPIQKDATEGVKVDLARVGIVALILAGAIAANFWKGLPAVGVWLAIALGALVRPTAWGELPAALKGSVFLLSLVVCASLMPVHELPPPTWPTALGIGFVSAVFDNIPLTKLALTQGGYDWGFLAFAVGYGGSMIWFGSSAGVALSTQYPDARSVGAWVKNGWHVTAAYVLGFFVMLGVLGWHPRSDAAKRVDGAGAVQSATPGDVPSAATPR